jgi:hypothetical protein
MGILLMVSVPGAIAERRIGIGNPDAVLGIPNIAISGRLIDWYMDIDVNITRLTSGNAEIVLGEVNSLSRYRPHPASWDIRIILIRLIGKGMRYNRNISVHSLYIRRFNSDMV